MGGAANRHSAGNNTATVCDGWAPRSPRNGCGADTGTYPHGGNADTGVRAVPALGYPRRDRVGPSSRTGSPQRGYSGERLSARVRQAQARRHRRAWIEHAGATPSGVPVWLSRHGWLHAVTAWANSPEFAVCKTATKVAITAATVRTIATAMTSHADHSTGRNCAVTRATLAHQAGCSPNTISNAWRVLRHAGFAFEAHRGHGSPTTHPNGRRPSIWHLTTPRPTHHTHPTHTAVPVHICDLPPTGGLLSVPHVGKNSPNARTRARKNPSRTKNSHHTPKRSACSPATTHQPRPLALQRLAAELITLCHGLDKPGKTHIGAICDTLTQTGFTPNTWSADKIVEALNTDMGRTGSAWPNHIHHPAAFLATRLRRITTPTTTPPPPPPPPNPTQPATPKQPLPPPAVAYREHRTGYLKATQALKNTRTPSIRRNTPAPTPQPRISHHPTGTCRCGKPAPARPFLPTHRQHICNTCWTQPT